MWNELQNSREHVMRHKTCDIWGRNVNLLDTMHNQQIRDPTTGMLKVSEHIANCANAKTPKCDICFPHIRCILNLKMGKGNAFYQYPKAKTDTVLIMGNVTYCYLRRMLHVCC